MRGNIFLWKFYEHDGEEKNENLEFPEYALPSRMEKIVFIVRFVWRGGCCEILLNYFSILKIILRQSLSCIWTISHQINYIIQIDSRLLNNICKNLKFERIHEMNSLPRFIHSSIIYMCVYLTTKSSIKIFPISYTDFLLLLNITTDLQKWNSRVHQVSFRRTERHVVHEGTGCNSLPRCGYPTVLPV